MYTRNISCWQLPFNMNGCLVSQETTHSLSRHQSLRPSCTPSRSIWRSPWVRRPQDFTADTSFMEAGLDSLDLLKVTLSCHSTAAPSDVI